MMPIRVEPIQLSKKKALIGDQSHGWASTEALAGSFRLKHRRRSGSPRNLLAGRESLGTAAFAFRFEKQMKRKRRLRPVRWMGRSLRTAR